MANVYYATMNAETCCDYWTMDAIVYGINDGDARLTARQKFLETFGREPNTIFVHGVDIDNLKPQFIHVISQYNDSK
jgi:hypothetical protein